jgi:hypothetical protein
MTHIPFLSEEGTIINFNQDQMSYSELLDMLYRNSHERRPIKTKIREHDLKLALAICEFGLSPCPYQTVLQPDEFDSYRSLCDYMGIDVEEDAENDCLNDFLSFLGLETDTEDDAEDLYEGWSDEMIAEQKQENKEMDFSGALESPYADVYDDEDDEMDEYDHWKWC